MIGNPGEDQSASTRADTRNPSWKEGHDAAGADARGGPGSPPYDRAFGTPHAASAGGAPAPPDSHAPPGGHGRADPPPPRPRRFRKARKGRGVRFWGGARAPPARAEALRRVAGPGGHASAAAAPWSGHRGAGSQALQAPAQ